MHARHTHSRYSRDDGLVQQTTFYSDYELTTEVLRVDTFKNRMDGLQRLEVKELEDRDQCVAISQLKFH